MLRKRLIFTLIYCDGYFMQSRNFRLQKVGDIKWLKQNYKFKKTSFSIDELIILDASRENKLSRQFLDDVESLAMDCFIPISVGGGVDSLEKCKKLFSKGADKIVLNTVLESNIDFVKEASSYYGAQSLIGSIDVKRCDEGYLIFNRNGSSQVNFSIENYFLHLEKIGVGEIYLNSIDQDGTGFGYDKNLIKAVENNKLPLIIAGGAGNYLHLISALKNEKIYAAATANLFNFMGKGLAEARQKLIEENLNISKWESYD